MSAEFTTKNPKRIRFLEYEPGDEVELLVQRDNEESDLEVTLGSRIVIEGSEGP